MFRFALGVSLVAIIYMHSPHRPAEGPLAAASSLTDAAGAAIDRMTIGADATAILAGTALRRTLTDRLGPEPSRATGSEGSRPVE